MKSLEDSKFHMFHECVCSSDRVYHDLLTLMSFHRSWQDGWGIVVLQNIIDHIGPDMPALNLVSITYFV